MSNVDGTKEAEAGTTSTPASALRVDGWVLLDTWTCRIAEVETSGSKVTLKTWSVFEQRQREVTVPATQIMEVPTVTTTEYRLMNLEEDGSLILLDDSDEQRDDLLLPRGEVGKEVRSEYKADNAVVLYVTKAMDREEITGWKPGEES